MKYKILAALFSAAMTFGAAQAETRAVSGQAATAAPDYFARDAFKAETIICPFKGKVQYKPGEISCGLLSVPENREKPTSRMIQLHYVKLAARKPLLWDEKTRGPWKKRDDAIIYLTGGPGVTVTGYTNRLKDHGARDTRDLYILEQRGIGFSEDFCPLYPTLDPKTANANDRDSAQAAQIKIAEDCFKSAAARGVDLSSYNTIENARDVEALRRALGFKQWNVWGISYGSYLGQAYLKEDPEGVRAAVIDAIVPLEQRVQFMRIATHFQRDLDLLDKACAANPVCAKSFKSSSDRIKGAITKVAKEPIVIEDPIDDEVFPNGKATFFEIIIAGVPFQAFYEQKTYATLPAMIDAMAQMVDKKDYAALRTLTVGGPVETAGDAFIAQGMYNAISCNDGWVAGLEQAVIEDQKANPVIGGAMQGDPKFAAEQAAMCVRNGLPPRSPEWYGALVTDIPMIVANGQMDPITPPPLAQAIMPGLKNATYVEFPYAGHGPTRSVKCAGDFLTKFFDAPTAKVDTKCADDMKAPEFTGPLFRTDAVLRMAGAAAENPAAGGMMSLGLGVPALILLIGAFIYSAAPVARFVNGNDVMSTSGARPLAWLVSMLGVVSLAGLGLGIAMSTAANETMVLVGLLGWTKWFAWGGIATGVLGAVLFIMTLAARARAALPIGVLLGLVLTALSGVSVAMFLHHWGFAPF
jgi:pimeloyl-ACP methyl ester carboxylesterase